MRRLLSALILSIMKDRFIISALALAGACTTRNQTAGEKAKDVANDVSRFTTKGVHRAIEAFCSDDDLKCLAKKAKHRAIEAADAAKDKASEIKDKSD